MQIIEEIEEVQTEEKDIFNYVKQIIASQMEIKAIQDDIKTIKAEAKDNGILVKEIDSVISDIKRELKKDPSVSMIEADIRNKIENNADIMDSISMVI